MRSGFIYTWPTKQGGSAWIRSELIREVCVETVMPDLVTDPATHRVRALVDTGPKGIAYHRTLHVCADIDEANEVARVIVRKVEADGRGQR